MSTSERIARLVFAVGLLISITFAIVADVEAQGRFGFYGGLNFANMGGDIDDFGNELAAELEDITGVPWTVSKSSKIGLGFGAYYCAPLSQTLGIQIEGQYIRRGVMFDLKTWIYDHYSGERAGKAFKLDYFELPILLRLSPSPDNDMQPVFLIGPVVGFNTKADLEVKTRYTSASEDAGEFFKSMNFGAILGAGFSVRMNENTSLLLQARYYLGLSNVLDSIHISSKSGDFGFFAGMEFGI